MATLHNAALISWHRAAEVARGANTSGQGTRGHWSAVTNRHYQGPAPARVKNDDTLFDDTSADTFDDTFEDTFNDLHSFNYPLRTLLIASCCC